MQDSSISFASALRILQSCTKLSRIRIKSDNKFISKHDSSKPTTIVHTLSIVKGVVLNKLWIGKMINPDYQNLHTNGQVI